MKVFIAVITILFLAAVPLAAADAPSSEVSTARASIMTEPKFRPDSGPGAIGGDYIVVLRDVPAEQVGAIVRDLSQKHGVTAKEVWTRALKGSWVAMPEATAKTMSQDPRVRYIEQNARMFKTSGSPQVTDRPAPVDGTGAASSEPYPAVYGSHPLWHLWRLNHRHREGAPHTYTYAPDSDGQGVRIFVVDTGVSRFHQEFIDTGYNGASPAERADPTIHKQVKEFAGSNVTDSNIPQPNPTNKRHWASSGPYPDCTGNALALDVDDDSSKMMPYPTPPWWDTLNNYAHGTAVGSVAGGRNVGVAKGAEIVPVKTDECSGNSSTAYFVRAFEWIIAKARSETPRKPAVVTMSTYRTLTECETWEGGRCKGDVSNYAGFLSAFEEAVQAAVDDGIPVVVSANNNGRDACHESPSRLSRSGGIGGLGKVAGGVITVGGLAKDGDWRYLLLPDEMTTDDIPPDASNWGPCVDLWAPAERIPAAWTKSWKSYRDRPSEPAEAPGVTTGTSFSAPMVAGLIARIFSEDSALSTALQCSTPDPQAPQCVAARKDVPETIWNRLLEASTPFELDALYGASAGDRHDAALRALANDPMTGGVLRATPRRMAYMGAFSFQQQPTSIALTGTRQTLQAVPVDTAAHTTEWHAVSQDGTDSTLPPTDNALCIQLNTVGCQSPQHNTRYWARVTKADGSGLRADSAMATVVVNKPVITEQPKNTWVRDDKTVKLSVTVIVPHGTTKVDYEWYSGFPGSMTLLSTTSTENPIQLSNTYDAGFPSATKSYYVIVRAAGESVTSEVALVRLESTCTSIPQLSNPVITPPFETTPPPDELFKVDLPAAGQGLEYHWYAGEKGDLTHRLKSPAGYPLFGNPVQFQAGPTKIFARVYSGNGCNHQDSETIKIPPPCLLTLEVSDTKYAVPYGGSRVLSVVARNGSGSYEYTWYSEPDGQAPEELTGLHSSEVDVKAGVYRVRVRDTNANCAVLSKQLHVKEYPSNSTCPSIKLPQTASYTIFQHAELTVPFILRSTGAPYTLFPGTTYQWLPGGSDIPAPQVAVCNECDRATRAATVSETLRLRLKGQCETASIGTSVEDSGALNLFVIPCSDTSAFAITSNPRVVGVVAPFSLEAPRMNGATYEWFRITTAGDIQLGVTTEPSFEVLPGINETTRYFVDIKNGACGPGTRRSQILTINPCSQPRRRPVRKTTSPPGSPADPIVAPAGTFVSLSVDDDHDGVTFQWYRGVSGDTSNPLGTSATESVEAIVGTKSYWVRLTRSCNGAPQFVDTDPITVTGTCAAEIRVQPASATATMPTADHQQPASTLTASIVAVGTSLTYEWLDLDHPGSEPLSRGSSYTWVCPYDQHAPAVVEQNVQVRITAACGNSVLSEPIRLTMVKATAQSILGLGGGGAVYPIGHATLSVRMTPSGPQHSYHYAWYRDNGTAEGEPLAHDSEDINVPTSMASYWVKVTGTHHVTEELSYTEVSVSSKLHVWPYGTCPIPPVTVFQSATSVPDGVTPVVFTASCDWDNITFQWYEGQTGDTRTPRPSDPGKNHQLTLTAPKAVWVRASVECGAFQDSDTVTVSRGQCYPMLINQHVASVDVPYGGTASLHLDEVPNAEYTWYKGLPGLAVPGQHSETLTLSNVTASGLYRAHVANLDSTCDTSANSFVATVRVASCGSIIPPAWETDVWTNKGVPATIGAEAEGESSYQWFSGEVGDDRNPLIGQTLATFETPSLTADARYWVRVIGNGCVVDSPTITVRVCVPPEFSGGQTFYRNIVPNQTISWHTSAIGTALTYRWYQGEKGDESHPIGPDLDWFRITPSETTHYWVKVTGQCGSSIESETYTANVCPYPTDPTAAHTIVMPGSTTTLSVTVPGTGVSYQWYIGSWDDMSHPIPGATTPTITSPQLMATTSFWCRVTRGTCSINSAPVTVEVCPPRQLTWHYNARTEVEKNDSQVISMDISGSGEVNLVLYLGAVAGDVEHSTAIPLVANAYQVHSDVTKTYWGRATSVNGCYTDSVPLTIEVCIPKIVTDPQSVLLDKTNPAATTTLTVAADITPVTYQWYSGASGDTSNPIAGQTSSTLVVSPSSDTTYWARVEGSCGHGKNSDAATVTVCHPSVIAAVHDPAQIQSGSSTWVGVSATGTDLTYQWYRGTSGDIAHPISGTAASVQVSPAVTTSYWCRVTSRASCSADSGTITVNVCSPPVITGQPQSPPRNFSGTEVTLGVTTTSDLPKSYQWYTGASGDTAAPVSGATAQTLTVSPTADTTYWVRITTGVCSVDSEAATVTMCHYPQSVTLPAGVNIAYGGSTTLQFPTLYPLNQAKFIRWYRGAAGDHSNLVHYSTQHSSLDYTTPALTATTQYWVEFEHLGCLSTSNATTVNVCKPTITGNPSGTTIASGAQATLSVTTTPISGQTFQWYTGTPGNVSSPVAGGTTASINVSPTATTSYWVRVKGTCTPEATVDSAGATVTVCNPPGISSVSPTQNIASGTQTAVMVTATGSNLTYQWYVGTSGTTTSPISGATSSLRYVTPTSTTSYWCKVTSEGLCSVNSATTTVNVCTPPVITQQPQAIPARIFSGSSAALSVTATENGVTTYQWYAGTAGNTASPIAGATSRTLSVSPATDTSYWVRVTTSVCSTDSAAVTVSLCTFSPVVTLPATRDIASGESVTLPFPTMSPGNEVKAIRWYRGAAGDRTNLVGSSAAAYSLSYTTPPLTANTQYWMEFDHNGCLTTSTATLVRVCKPAITQQPQNAVILEGNPHTLTVATTGSPLTYQWYIGNSGVTSQPVAGATSASLSVTPSATTTYWVRATGCSTTADSAAATVTVCTAPAVTNLTKTSTYAIGSTGSLTVTATGTSLSYQWYKGQSGDTSQPISGATSASYSFTLQTSQYYWARVTSGCNGATANSAALLYSVSPNITAHPADVTIARGTSTTLSVTATGTYLSYQWFKGDSTAIAGATSSTYTTPALSTGVNEYWCMVTSGTVSKNSVHAFVSLCDGPTILSFNTTYNSGSTYRLTAMVHSSQYGVVKYLWYTGVVGNPSQSTFLGELSYQEYFNVTTPKTYWVRIWFTDNTCYTDTAGKTLP